MDQFALYKYLRQELQLTPSELNGYVIFNTEKGDCFHCHGTEMFMDNLFHNNGLDIEPFLDIGLAKVKVPRFPFHVTVVLNVVAPG